MTSIKNTLKSCFQEPVKLLDHNIPIQKYTPIDLSVYNPEMADIDICFPESCQAYIDKVLARANASVAYGGYLEKRNLYNAYAEFSTGESNRNIHLGLDLWTHAGTGVCAPLTGQVHSYQNNDSRGDYGPTIILKHILNGFSFYTLYGHLSLESLLPLQVGATIYGGAVFATLGTPEINVNYAPHLHFQLILDIGDHYGDYPGVCEEANLAYFSDNCPNPNLLLKI